MILYSTLFRLPVEEVNILATPGHPRIGLRTRMGQPRRPGAHGYPKSLRCLLRCAALACHCLPHSGRD